MHLSVLGLMHGLLNSHQKDNRQFTNSLKVLFSLKLHGLEDQISLFFSFGQFRITGRQFTSLVAFKLSFISEDFLDTRTGLKSSHFSSFNPFISILIDV